MNLERPGASIYYLSTSLVPYVQRSTLFDGPKARVTELIDGGISITTYHGWRGGGW